MADDRAFRTPSKDAPVYTRTWLKSIDSSLLRYEEDLLKLDYTNITCLKFLTSVDLEQFQVKPSAVHRRMLINGVAKLQTPKSKLGLESPSRELPPKLGLESASRELPPKQLQFQESGIVDVENERSNNDFIYESPSELMIKDLEDEASVKKVELESAQCYADDLKVRYCPVNITIDKTNSQCSLCHLREKPAHQRRRCPWGECLGPGNCGDLDKHPHEKKLVMEAATEVRNKEKEIDKLERDIDNKRKAVMEVQRSFKHKILSALVNTDVDKYTFYTNKGRVLKLAVINNDVHILDKHYGGRVPKYLDTAKLQFPGIIAKFNSEHIHPGTSKTAVKSQVQKILEKKNVTFPNFEKGATVDSDRCLHSNHQLGVYFMPGIPTAAQPTQGVPGMVGWYPPFQQQSFGDVDTHRNNCDSALPLKKRRTLPE
jgi:hypothetical protein